MQTRDIEFVDPSAYGISLNQSLPGYTHSFDVQQNTSMVTYATISGRYSGTTQTFIVPFPYWELWYTAEPSGKTGGQDQSMSTSTITGPKQSGLKGSGSSQTIMEGSYSVTFPVFSIDVMDGSDPNRIVRSITPPGGLDKDLWGGITIESEEEGGESIEIGDPRPWKEKFYEGERDYFFVITTQSLDSYTIEIKVPMRYLDNSTAAV